MGVAVHLLALLGASSGFRIGPVKLPEAPRIATTAPALSAAAVFVHAEAVQALGEIYPGGDDGTIGSAFLESASDGRLATAFILLCGLSQTARAYSSLKRLRVTNQFVYLVSAQYATAVAMTTAVRSSHSHGALSQLSDSQLYAVFGAMFALGIGIRWVVQYIYQRR